MKTTPLPATAPPLPNGWASVGVAGHRLGELDSQAIRIRMTGAGPASQRTFTGDTQRAVQLLASPAGAKLEQALRRFVSAADAAHGHENLSTFTLAQDMPTVAAAQLRAATETDPEVRDANVIRKRVIARDYTKAATKSEGMAGAFNVKGNIVVMPDMARYLLASVGAYAPTPAELRGLTADRLHLGLPQLMRHEVEHSITPGDTVSGGVEEATAELLALAQPARVAEATDLPPASEFGQTDAVSVAATSDWSTYVNPYATDPTAGDKAIDLYEARRVALETILKSANVDPDTNAGYAQARELLQGTAQGGAMYRVSRLLLTNAGKDPKTATELWPRLETMVNAGSTADLAQFRSDFGV